MHRTGDLSHVGYNDTLDVSVELPDIYTGQADLTLLSYWTGVLVGGHCIGSLVQPFPQIDIFKDICMSNTRCERHR